MSAARGAAGLANHVGRAGRGVLRLARFDPRWSEAFDVSTEGFLRSFLARLAGLPFYLVFVINLERAVARLQPERPATFWPEAAAFLLESAAFPVLIVMLARPLGIARGYAAFIVVVNWTALFLNLLLGATSLLLQGGESGLAAFGVVWFVLAALAVYLTWRAARETLTQELAPLVLVVMLSVACGALCDQLVAWLGRVLV